MSPTYLNGVPEERGSRPESPRSPTKTVIPITPGLVPPTSTSLYSSYNTPSPEPSSSGANGNGGNALTVNTSTSSLVYPSSFTNSPMTPVRESEMTRKRSNSMTEKESEKDATTASIGTTTTTSRGRPSRSKDAVSNPMKSFRVNLDDPCWKVLPAAMKKYDVKGREEDYRLYITYGDIGSPPPSFPLPRLTSLLLPYLSRCLSVCTEC